MSQNPGNTGWLNNDAKCLLKACILYSLNIGVAVQGRSQVSVLQNLMKA